MKQKYELVVFDIGGVLADLTGFNEIAEWTKLTVDEAKSYWLKIDVVREFELGNIAYEEFAKKILKELNLAYSIAELRNHMESWTAGLFPDAESIVYQVKQSIDIACLSNMNAVQWPTLRDTLGIGSWFRDQFISHQIGKLKPDQEAYEEVTEKLGIAPEKIIFFDDNKDNIEGAKQLGWSAYLVQGTTELSNQLKKLNLI
jgi:glucose-1-phosphatase